MKKYKHKCPPYYHAALRHKKDMVKYLEHTEGAFTCRSYEHSVWLVCFDVKIRSADLSWENLVVRIKEMGYGQELPWDDAYWLNQAKEEFNDVNETTLLDWGLESARSHVEDANGHRGCSYSSLWTGEDLDVRWGFHGRSGGWLILEKFNGVDLTRHTTLAELDFKTIRQLYRFVVQCCHDFRPLAVQTMVEEGAAFDFFMNICGGLKTSKDREKVWMTDQSGEHDFAVAL